MSVQRICRSRTCFNQVEDVPSRPEIEVGVIFGVCPSCKKDEKKQGETLIKRSLLLPSANRLFKVYQAMMVGFQKQIDELFDPAEERLRIEPEKKSPRHVEPRIRLRLDEDNKS